MISNTLDEKNLVAFASDNWWKDASTSLIKQQSALAVSDCNIIKAALAPKILWLFKLHAGEHYLDSVALGGRDGEGLVCVVGVGRGVVGGVNFPTFGGRLGHHTVVYLRSDKVSKFLIV